MMLVLVMVRHLLIQSHLKYIFIFGANLWFASAKRTQTFPHNIHHQNNSTTKSLQREKQTQLGSDNILPKMNFILNNYKYNENIESILSRVKSRKVESERMGLSQEKLREKNRAVPCGKTFG